MCSLHGLHRAKKVEETETTFFAPLILKCYWLLAPTDNCKPVTVDP